MKRKESENRVNRGENHTRVISSSPKGNFGIRIGVAVELKKLKRRNCPSKYMKGKKILKNEQLRVVLGDHLILNSKVKMLRDGQVQKASRTVFEMPQ